MKTSPPPLQEKYAKILMKFMVPGITLTRHILEGQKAHPGATGEFSSLLTQVALAGKRIAYELTRAGFLGEMGLTGEVNIHGEKVKKLDDISNQIFIDSFQYLDLVSMVVSEELNMAEALHGQTRTGKYTLYIDPMDGSSNIDVNGVVGSIFSIHRNQDGKSADANLLQKGSTQVTAGYLMYGPSTLLVLACCGGVHAFTLDMGIGEFVLTQDKIHIPARGKNISINAGNYANWDPGLRAFINHVQSRTDKKELFTYRYAATFVADFHRVLLEGGVFMYPGDTGHPQGKLRLLYEVAPMAFVAEAAGGKASSGKERILDIQPTDIHQHVPVIIGSTENVKEVLQFL